MRSITTARRALAAVLAGGALAASATPAAAQEAADVLPDLDQAVPSDVQVRSLVVGGEKRFRLGFASAAANVGAGPLTLHGHRPDRQTPTMRVDQLVDRTLGAPRLVRDVGVLSYVVHPDHRHWHLLGFERYELRRPGAPAGEQPTARDRKTGFCLGDRFPVANAAALPGFSTLPMQADLCGLGRPDLLGLFSGISVGYADRYEAQIEGQFIDVTGLPAGRYDLVHTVNTEGRIAERDYTNNASSVLLSLTWPRGPRAAPRVAVLRRCSNAPTCAR